MRAVFDHSLLTGLTRWISGFTTAHRGRRARPTLGEISRIVMLGAGIAAMIVGLAVACEGGGGY